MDDLQLQLFVQSFCKAKKLPGLSVSVAKGGEDDKHFFAGFADLESKQPVTINTVYHLGSVSKLCTVMLTFVLTELHIIAMDTQLGEITGEELRDTADSRVLQITIWQLLNHRSGLPFGRQKLFTHQEVIDNIKQSPLLFDPGTAYKYSTIAYALLGTIIEKVTGETYDHLLRKYILNKMDEGIYTYSTPDGALDTSYIAQAYSPGAPVDIIDNADELKPSGIFLTSTAASGLFGTCKAQLQLGKLLLGNAVLKGILTVQSLDTLVYGMKDIPPHDSCSLLHSAWLGVPYFFQNGYSTGQSNVLVAFPQQQICISIACNRRWQQNLLLVTALKLFSFIHCKHPLHQYNSELPLLSPSNLRGDFRASNGDLFAITEDSKRLWLINKSGKYALLPFGNQAYFISYNRPLLYPVFNNDILSGFIWGDNRYHLATAAIASWGTAKNKNKHLCGVYYHPEYGSWWVTIKEEQLLCLHGKHITTLHSTAHPMEFIMEGTAFFGGETIVFNRDPSGQLTINLGGTIYSRINDTLLCRAV